jgi:signal peptidase I
MNDISAHIGSSWKTFVFGRNPKKTLLRVCLWTVAINLSFHSLLLPITVSGISMSPTYESGARNLVNKLAYVRQAPKRGDVIVLRTNENEMFIKRIVALPGETVFIADGEINIDDRCLRDAHSTLKIPWNTEPVVLKENEYFVIGDNRECSVFGPIRHDQIVGKVIF